MREEHKQSGKLRRTYETKKDEITGNEEDYIKRSFMNYMPQQQLFG
jgi:hypothetical protein